MIPLREDNPVYSKDIQVFTMGTVTAAKSDKGRLYITCGSALMMFNDLAAITIIRAFMSNGVAMMAVDQNKDNLMLMPLDMFVQLLLEQHFKEIPFDEDTHDSISNIYGYGIRSLVSDHFKVAPKLPSLI